ncbi:hypothetical protein Q8A73_008425 [Channa argus]|nr:hypothetical protein Q8A73_008425 [Channa argus]
MTGITMAIIATTLHQAHLPSTPVILAMMMTPTGIDGVPVQALGEIEMQQIFQNLTPSLKKASYDSLLYASSLGHWPMPGYFRQFDYWNQNWKTAPTKIPAMRETLITACISAATSACPVPTDYCGVILPNPTSEFNVAHSLTEVQNGTTAAPETTLNCMLVNTSKQDHQEKTIAYATHVLTKAERKTSTYDRELWAIVWAMPCHTALLTETLQSRVFPVHLLPVLTLI